MSKESANLIKTIEHVSSIVNKQISHGAIDDIDNMTVKDLKLKIYGETQRILTNDEKASVVSVVVLIIFGREKEQGEGGI